MTINELLMVNKFTIVYLYDHCLSLTLIFYKIFLKMKLNVYVYN